MWNPTLVAVVDIPPGVHLNIPASIVTPAMEDYLVEPAAPQAVIAGVQTAFLEFADEAEARAICPQLWIDAPPPMPKPVRAAHAPVVAVAEPVAEPVQAEPAPEATPAPEEPAP